MMLIGLAKVQPFIGKILIQEHCRICDQSFQTPNDQLILLLDYHIGLLGAICPDCIRRGKIWAAHQLYSRGDKWLSNARSNFELEEAEWYFDMAQEISHIDPDLWDNAARFDI